VTIILDTNVLSELRLAAPDANVAAWFAAQPEREIAVASFSIAEIAYGIASATSARLITPLSAWLDSILATQRILPLDGPAARLLGRLYAVPALRHLALTPPGARKPRFGGDLTIAATAVVNEATVATRNVADFRLIASHCPGLSVVDPWSGDIL
jgi:predicted nucleic acid-binding protein